jgi:hypothetical protein
MGEESGKVGLIGKAREGGKNLGSKQASPNKSDSKHKPLPLSGTKGEGSNPYTGVARPEPSGGK